MSAALASYDSFLVNNVSTISTVESSLRSITWLLPGRFKDAELASEARQSILRPECALMTSDDYPHPCSISLAQCDEHLP